MQYLVVGSEGPGFATPDETLAVLENGILPTFEHIMQLEREGRIVAGGLPLGDRAFVMIIEAASNDELDRVLRDIPAWGVLNWQVTALQAVSARASKEREVVQQIKEMMQVNGATA